MFDTVIKPIATLMESMSVNHGLHIALTGGSLYKSGARKDIDFVLYHASGEQRSYTAVEDFFSDLHASGFSNIKNYGRVTKCTYEGQSIDILYPEYMHRGEYTFPEGGPLDYAGHPIAIYDHHFPKLRELL